MDVFHRTVLAADLAEKILQVTPGSASSSGLFLAAPRRTGKSTFLREDLRPQLEKSGALVLYVDLWEDRRADPGTVIVNAVRAELARHDGVLARLAKSTGLEKISIRGAGFNLAQVGLGTVCRWPRPWRRFRTRPGARSCWSSMKRSTRSPAKPATMPCSG